jgi:hypothetical protein
VGKGLEVEKGRRLKGRALVEGALKEGMVAEHAVVCAPLGMRNTFKDQG